MNESYMSYLFLNLHAFVNLQLDLGYVFMFLLDASNMIRFIHAL